jgi:hypothetical protein
MIPLLRLLFLVQLFHLIYRTSAAFSLNAMIPYYGYIQQNPDRTWCYYPVARVTSAVTCGPDYTRTLAVHLNQTVSIGYYRPDGSRAGGPEWPLPPTNPVLIFACVSGRAQDGTYQTACTVVTADNSFPSPGCAVAIAQSVVTDGCYEPGALPYTTEVATQTVTSQPAASDLARTMTVTQTITPGSTSTVISSSAAQVHRAFASLHVTLISFQLTGSLQVNGCVVATV